MASDEHVAKLKQGVKAWNAWREANPAGRAAIRHGHLYAAPGAFLSADLSEEDLAADLAEEELRLAGRSGFRSGLLLPLGPRVDGTAPPHFAHTILAANHGTSVSPG